MIEKINKIIELLNSAVRKDEFKEAVLDLEAEIKAYLKEVEYNPANLKTIDIDPEPLEQLEHKLSQIKENKFLGIFEGVQKYQAIMRNFLKIYHIGFLREFRLSQNGMFKCHIPTQITKSTVQINSYSEEVEFENQLNTLQKMGIVISKGKRGDVKIEATQENIEGLKRILNLINAKSLDIRIQEYEDCIFVRDIEFRVSPESLDNFTEIKEPFKLPVTEEINLDEIQRVYHLLKEMVFAYSNTKTLDIPDTCAHLVISYFVQICDTLNIETSIQKEEYEKEKAEREKNAKKNEIRQEIGKYISAQNLKDSVKIICNKIEEKLNLGINFNCYDISVSPYDINVSASIISGMWFGNNIMSDEDFCSMFEHYKECSRENYSLLPLATENNIKTIQNFIFMNFFVTKFNSIKIKSKTEDYTTNYYDYIDSFDFSITNLGIF